jgi:hypothetical protein
VFQLKVCQQLSAKPDKEWESFVVGGNETLRVFHCDIKTENKCLLPEHKMKPKNKIRAENPGR